LSLSLYFFIFVNSYDFPVDSRQKLSALRITRISLL
jgi:hypothetical protein